VAAGAALFVATNASFDALGDSLLAATLAVAGLFLIFGPWWWRLGRELFEERRRRIRSEERAEVAARIHDSVLQTLAFIQKNAADPVETTRLARRQERELRSWLFEDGPPPSGTLKSGMRAAADEIEDLYGITVEVVVVGDCASDDALHALAAATREALVNAAKFSGEASVSLYVEVEPDAVTAFVRDRGVGFDPRAVPPDRRGIAESMVGRMQRHGGQVTVHSAPGAGAEVELVVPMARR
jgi:signal transduction histidine kinase